MDPWLPHFVVIDRNDRASPIGFRNCRLCMMFSRPLEKKLISCIYVHVTTHCISLHLCPCQGRFRMTLVQNFMHMQDDAILPGGGSTEVLIAEHVRRQTSQHKMQKEPLMHLAHLAFAEALEYSAGCLIPTISPHEASGLLKNAALMTSIPPIFQQMTSIHKGRNGPNMHDIDMGDTHSSTMCYFGWISECRQIGIVARGHREWRTIRDGETHEAGGGGSDCVPSKDVSRGQGRARSTECVTAENRFEPISDAGRVQASVAERAVVTIFEAELLDLMSPKVAALSTAVEVACMMLRFRNVLTERWHNVWPSSGDFVGTASCGGADANMNEASGCDVLADSMMVAIQKESMSVLRFH